MRALVVYESMNPGTEAVAHALAKGLAETCETELVCVYGSGADSIGNRATGCDLLVAGMADSDNAVRDWCAGAQPGEGRLAAVFDTRGNVSPAVSGSAASATVDALAALGYTFVDDPMSFFVLDSGVELAEGETWRATVWGATLGRRALNRNVPVSSR